MIITPYLGLALVLGLLSTSALASPPGLFASGICTHMDGLDVEEQVKPMQPAGPNAIQDTRNTLIDRLGLPTFEKRHSSGSISLTWAREASAESVYIEISEGNLKVSCGLTF
ncbi:hypothetical protein ACQR1W_27205 [Bradyrhizobium sp. HKCCYLS1011]|uniref:hypothetical protein n=1 Tax=Bradyrhizobium sp. HKCCYLS1011 TaxID=3420733 RepID=UPI003EBE8690